MIAHLAAFLAVFSEETRLKYLPVLAEIRAETDNWRFRHMLASQVALSSHSHTHTHMHLPE